MILIWCESIYDQTYSLWMKFCTIWLWIQKPFLNIDCCKMPVLSKRLFKLNQLCRNSLKHWGPPFCSNSCRPHINRNQSKPLQVENWFQWFFRSNKFLWAKTIRGQWIITSQLPGKTSINAMQKCMFLTIV